MYNNHNGQSQGYYPQPQASINNHYYGNQNPCCPPPQNCGPCATQCGPVVIPRAMHCTQVCQVRMWQPPMPQAVCRTTCSVTTTQAVCLPCDPCAPRC